MQTAPYRFQLLAPPGTPASNSSGSIIVDVDAYERYLASLQKLRAQTYIADGAIGRERLDEDGRFHMPRDQECWHFLLVNGEDEVVGCVRYLAHPTTVMVEDLSITYSPVSRDAVWGPKFLGALESDLAYARKHLLTFIEIGGWAIEASFRHTRAALEILLASFAWARLIGGAIGCCTATSRNSSASMLRRIGGRSLEHNNEVIPPYSDPNYGCMMEALRFHFQDFDPRYRKMVDNIYARITEQSPITGSLEAVTCHEDSLRTVNNLRALDRALQSANVPVVMPAGVSL